MDKQSSQFVRFQALWQRLGGDSRVDEVFSALLDLYEGEGRYYHNLGHIEYCLSVFDEARDFCQQPDTVELAIWFHDIIYEMGGSGNELKSAEHFIQASEGQIDDAVRRQVYDLIIATDHSFAPSADQPDFRFIVEVDLSGFGLPWTRFRSDGRNVRNEMMHLSDDEFYPAQMRFMQTLAERSPLYTYAWFNDRFEGTARANIARYTSELQTLGYELKP